MSNPYQPPSTDKHARYLGLPWLDGGAATWRGLSPRESFWPGRLDYVTFDTSKLRAVGGYSMNTEVLGKLKPELTIDAPVSDHAMLVVDLKPAE